MSERMIELHRARLLAAGKGSRSGDGQNGSQPVASLASAKTPTAAQAKQTPQEAAASAVQAEDVQLDRFLQRLQDRDDSRPASTSGPTVPTALARRMLQKQGVGFLDSTVAAVASAAADRFLATVLQQAVACRVQRLEGAEVTRQAVMARKRHMQQVEADADDRKRRRTERLKNREKANLAAISAAEALKKTGASPLKDGEGSTAAKSKKKKKPDSETGTVNGNRLKHDQDDDEDSYDSLDEEEDYYKQYYGEASGDVDEDDEEDDTLILKDIARPLEAWDFHVTGKHGLISTAKEEDEEEDVAMDDDEEELEGPAASDQNQDQFDDDDGDDDSADDMTAKTTASSTGKSGKTKSPQDKKRKATSPVPPSANSSTPPSNKE